MALTSAESTRIGKVRIYQKVADRDNFTYSHNPLTLNS